MLGVGEGGGVLALGIPSCPYLGDLLIDLRRVAALAVWVLHRCKLQHAHAKAVHIHLLIILLLIQFWRHELRVARRAAGSQQASMSASRKGEQTSSPRAPAGECCFKQASQHGKVACYAHLRRAEHTLRRGEAAPERSQSQVADLDDATRAIYKDVVALEVAVDDGRVVCMQIHQSLQNLPCPPLEHLLVDVLVLLAVPAASTGGTGPPPHVLQGKICAAAAVRGGSHAQLNSTLQSDTTTAIGCCHNLATRIAMGCTAQGGRVGKVVGGGPSRGAGWVGGKRCAPRTGAMCRT